MQPDIEKDISSAIETNITLAIPANDLEPSEVEKTHSEVEKTQSEVKKIDTTTPAGRTKTRKSKLPRRTLLAVTGPIRKFKYKNGDRAQADVIKLQNTTDLLLPKASFKRLVKDIAHGFQDDIRVSSNAMQVLQEAAEAHVVSLLKCTRKVASHSCRDIIKVSDMILAREMCSG